MITTSSMSPADDYAALQQTHAAVMQRLTRIEIACESLGLPSDETTDALLISSEQWIPLREALDAG